MTWQVIAQTRGGRHDLFSLTGEHVMTIKTSDPMAIAKMYLAAWNEADDLQRRKLLEQAWAGDARYVDPLMHGEGRDDIARMIGNARTQFPGHHFTLSGTPDGHGVYVRFSWTLAPTGGAAVAVGSDMVRLDDQGRIAEVVGFLDSGAP
jgi:ketosteroid isomerase-like protein